MIQLSTCARPVLTYSPLLKEQHLQTTTTQSQHKLQCDLMSRMCRAHDPALHLRQARLDVFAIAEGAAPAADDNKQTALNEL
jgi:hypothetical protein